MIIKKKENEKKEAGVTLTVGIILATFLICTMPAAIVLETDPEAEKHSMVRGLTILIPSIIHLLWPGTHPHLHTELAGGGDQPCGVCHGMSEVQESSGANIMEH